MAYFILEQNPRATCLVMYKMDNDKGTSTSYMVKLESLKVYLGWVFNVYDV